MDKLQATFKGKIWAVGNSLVITLPSKFSSWYHLKEGDTITLELKEDNTEQDETATED